MSRHVTVYTHVVRSGEESAILLASITKSLTEANKIHCQRIYTTCDAFFEVLVYLPMEFLQKIDRVCKTDSTPLVTRDSVTAAATGISTSIHNLFQRAIFQAKEVQSNLKESSAAAAFSSSRTVPRPCDPSSQFGYVGNGHANNGPPLYTEISNRHQAEEDSGAHVNVYSQIRSRADDPRSCLAGCDPARFFYLREVNCIYTCADFP